MKKRVILTSLLLPIIFISGCSASGNDDKTKEVETHEKKQTTKIPENKLGIDSKKIIESNLNELTESKYELTNKYDSYLTSKNLKVEIFKESLSPIAFALFTKTDEKQPSALTIFSTMRLANSVVEKKFDDLILVLENSIPDNSKKYTSKSENSIDDNKFVTFVFNNDLNSNDLDELLADVLSGKDKKVQETTSSSSQSSKVPLEYTNAKIKAEEYINHSSFSKISLYKQLQYEKFSDEAANFAVENISTNWNKQAVNKAKEYMESMDISKEKLKDQLLYEGFTDSEITYALNNI